MIDTQTPNVKAFLAANRTSPVVSGYAIECDPRKPPRGGCYTLDDGTVWRFTVQEMRSMPMPDWGLADLL